MDMTVRARALAIEMEAREHAPAAAINALAVRCAQLESWCAEWKRRAVIAEAGHVDVRSLVAVGPVGNGLDVPVEHRPTLATPDGPVG